MNVEEIRTVGVVGAGSMGTGIIQVAAQSGFEVKAVDVDDAARARAAKAIAKILERLVAKEKITEEQKKQVLGRIAFSTDVATLKGVPFLFEAVFESVDVKKAIFSKLDAICGDEVVIREQHLFHRDHRDGLPREAPREVHRHALLQPGPGDEAGRGDPRPADRTGHHRPGAGDGEEARQDRHHLQGHPGFVVNRLLVPYMLDAVRLLEAGVASAEDIDTAMKLGTGMPMGPFELMDYTGVEISLLCRGDLPQLHEGGPVRPSRAAAEHGEGRVPREEDGQRLLRLPGEACRRKGAQ